MNDYRNFICPNPLPSPEKRFGAIKTCASAASKPLLITTPLARLAVNRCNVLMADAHSKNVVALVRDLMFSSKISATARAEGVPVTIVRDPARLADTPGGRLLVDLNLEGAIDAAAAWAAAAPGRQTIGFVSHVDTPAITRARAAGIQQVMARSQFTARLPQILTEST